MAWIYESNLSLQIVEAAYIGPTSAQDLKDSTSRFIALEKEEGLNRFLIDTREMKIDATFTDIFNLPEKQYLEEGADRDGRVAVILSSRAKERDAGLFYETVCQMRGWMVKVFQKRQEAIDWLTHDT